jgi:uncharacterized membrane protein
MAEREVSPARLEAISDGVIAVAITIMVLELHAPHDPSPAALTALWPDFVSYLLSFAFIATYWVNHRHVFRHIKAVDDLILWSNLGLLFLVSLIPFSTAYMGRTRMAAFPTALYSVVLALCGMGFAFLRAAVARHVRDPVERKVFNGPRVTIVGVASAATYLSAAVLAFFSPTISMVLIVLVAFVHMSPLTRSDP